MRRRGLAFEFFDESFRQGEQSLPLSLDFVDVLNDHNRTFDRAVFSNDWGTQQRYPRLSAIPTQAERFFDPGLLAAQSAGKRIFGRLQPYPIDSNRTPLRVIFNAIPRRQGVPKDTPRLWVGQAQSAIRRIGQQDTHRHGVEYRF
jgi:hypothetical protein